MNYQHFSMNDKYFQFSDYFLYNQHMCSSIKPQVTLDSQRKNTSTDRSFSEDIKQMFIYDFYMREFENIQEMINFLHSIENNEELLGTSFKANSNKKYALFSPFVLEKFFLTKIYFSEPENCFYFSINNSKFRVYIPSIQKIRIISFENQIKYTNEFINNNLIIQIEYLKSKENIFNILCIYDENLEFIPLVENIAKMWDILIENIIFEELKSQVVFGDYNSITNFNLPERISNKNKYNFSDNYNKEVVPDNRNKYLQKNFNESNSNFMRKDPDDNYFNQNPIEEKDKKNQFFNKYIANYPDNNNKAELSQYNKIKNEANLGNFSKNDNNLDFSKNNLQVKARVIQEPIEGDFIITKAVFYNDDDNKNSEKELRNFDEMTPVSENKSNFSDVNFERNERNSDDNSEFENKFDKYRNISNNDNNDNIANSFPENLMKISSKKEYEYEFPEKLNNNEKKNDDVNNPHLIENQPTNVIFSSVNPHEYDSFGDNSKPLPNFNNNYSNQIPQDEKIDYKVNLPKTLENNPNQKNIFIENSIPNNEIPKELNLKPFESMKKAEEKNIENVENKPKNIIEGVVAEGYFELLRIGKVFYKYGLNDIFRPAKRRIFITAGLDYLSWTSSLNPNSKQSKSQASSGTILSKESNYSNSNAKSSKMPRKKCFKVASILQILDGRNTTNFKRFKTKNSQRILNSFSLVYIDRTIDLEALNQQDKKEFLEALIFLINLNKSNPSK